MEATVEIVKDAILEAEILNEVADLKNDVLLSEQGFDSLDLVNVYMILENKFGIKIPDADLGQLLTINQIIAYLNARVA